MLSQPKRKQRLAADPQNQAWRQDNASVGHRLLAKMGWSEGKGLGKDGHGTTEYVRVKPNWELAGIGAAKEQLMNDSYAQLTNFDALLKQAWKEDESMEKKDKEERVKKDKEKRKDKEGCVKKDKQERVKKDKEGSVEKDRKKENRSNKKHKEKSKDERKSEKSAVVRPAHLAHRSKFIRNKQVGQYSEERLKEILLV